MHNNTDSRIIQHNSGILFFFFFLPVESVTICMKFVNKCPSWSYMLCHSVYRIYDIEKSVKTPEKYLFPKYETLNWYAAKHILDTLRGELNLACLSGCFRVGSPFLCWILTTVVSHYVLCKLLFTLYVS